MVHGPAEQHAATGCRQSAAAEGAGREGAGGVTPRPALASIWPSRPAAEGEICGGGGGDGREGREGFRELSVQREHAAQV